MNSIIIGANFGDEGKGLITDFEARRNGSSLNVRFNGGAQAGHTVVSENKRHIFSHVGASSFAGTDTYLSSNFILNPLFITSELDKLEELGVNPRIFVSSKCRVTTIFDMAINAIVEFVRSENNSKHGSCGMGINETVTRNNSEFTLTASDIKNINPAHLFTKLYSISAIWVPKRLKELGIDIKQVNHSAADVLRNPNLKIIMQDTIDGFQKYTIIDNLEVKGSVVFEGAQGLMLDEFLGTFPHVTRSCTGLPSALQAANELGIKEVQPIYVTRAYLTRHGAGELQNDGVTFCAKMPKDSTNVYNQFQDHIRYAPLDLTALRDFIRNDIARAPSNVAKFGEPTIAITCLDQVDKQVSVVIDGEIVTIKTKELPNLIEQYTGFKASHLSFGPTANDVVYRG